MLAPILTIVALGLHVVIAVILVRKYIRTRDVGFVWLGIAVIVWPLISRLLEWGERVGIDRVANRQWDGVYPLTLVAQGKITFGDLVLWLNLVHQLIGISLLLVAVLYLSRRNARLHPAR